MPLVDVRGHGNDRIEGVVYSIGLGESILDERRQVFPVPDQLVVVAKPRATCVLLEQCGIVLDRLSPLPQLFERREHVAGLVDRFKPRAEGGYECRIVGKWGREGLHPLDDASRLVGGVSF